MGTVDNHLISLIARTERPTLLGLCERVPLDLSEVLWEPGEVTQHLCFPVEGFVSLIAIVGGSPGLEIGMVGREGMLGAHSVMGAAKAPVRAVVQGQGWAWRAPANVFDLKLAVSPLIKRVLDRYVSVSMSQLITSVTCPWCHEIGPRLARRLLMSQDRACSNQFKMTHQFLACMLGVRRVGITPEAGLLQKAGLIQYARGRITVLDRTGLENAACGCYAVDRKDYAEAMR